MTKRIDSLPACLGMFVLMFGGPIVGICLTGWGIVSIMDYVKALTDSIGLGLSAGMSFLGIVVGLTAGTAFYFSKDNEVKEEVKAVSEQ